MNASRRRETFQLFKNATATPPKKVDKNCMKMDSLSPMPSWILSKSLQGESGDTDYNRSADDQSGYYVVITRQKVW